MVLERIVHTPTYYNLLHKERYRFFLLLWCPLLLLSAGIKNTWLGESSAPVALEGHMESHRITEWIALEGSIVGHLVQPDCLSGVIPGPTAQICTQMVVGYLQRERLHTLSGQSVPVFSHSHSKFFLMHKWNFSFTSFCLVPIVLSLGTTDESLALSSCHPPFR